jgi:integrase
MKQLKNNIYTKRVDDIPEFIEEDERVTNFKIHLMKSGGRKPRTIELHTKCLKRLIAHVPDLSPQKIELFLLSLKERGKKASYINDFISTLNAYGRSINSDIYSNLTYYKEEPFVKATLSDEEIEAVLTLPPTTVTRYHWKSKRKFTCIADPKGWKRWTLFFSIMAYTGMRPGEIAHLTVDRVDFGRGVFVLEDTKTNTPRNVPIPPLLIPQLQEHIRKENNKFLFPSRRGGSWRQDGVVDDVDWSYNFQVRIKRMGIKRKNLSIYSLRHSFVSRMLGADIALPTVQKIVGHKDIRTTAHYTHLTTTDTIRAIEKDPLTKKALTKDEKILAIREEIEQQGFVVTASKVLENGHEYYEIIIE